MAGTLSEEHIRQFDREQVELDQYTEYTARQMREVGTGEQVDVADWDQWESVRASGGQVEYGND